MNSAQTKTSNAAVPVRRSSAPARLDRAMDRQGSRPASRVARALILSLGGGGLLLWALSAQARPLVYVSEKHSNDAVVIDGASNTVVDHIGVGASPSGVAVSPDAQT